MLREKIAERPPHHLEIGACAMQHHDRKAIVARSDLDDVERSAGSGPAPAVLANREEILDHLVVVAELAVDPALMESYLGTHS